MNCYNWNKVFNVFFIVHSIVCFFLHLQFNAWSCLCSLHFFLILLPLESLFLLLEAIEKQKQSLLLCKMNEVNVSRYYMKYNIQSRLIEKNLFYIHGNRSSVHCVHENYSNFVVDTTNKKWHRFSPTIKALSISSAPACYSFK